MVTEPFKQNPAPEKDVVKVARDPGLDRNGLNEAPPTHITHLGERASHRLDLLYFSGTTIASLLAFWD